MPKDSNGVSSEDVVFPSPERPQKSSNAATGASAAGIRAISAQFIAFYFRAPMKAFFRTRFDYTGLARAINPHVLANEGWSWRVSTPGLLAHAVKEHVSSDCCSELLLLRVLKDRYKGMEFYTQPSLTTNARKRHVCDPRVK